MRVRTRPGHPDFLDLPWDAPLEEWDSPRLVEVARGLHRHVVRFVDYDGALYALKQMSARLAQREHAMLRRMAGESLPVVEAVGVVGRAAVAGGLPDVLITRYLDFSLPYRTLFAHQHPEPAEVRGLYNRLLDALTMLLVRLHLNGFFWGDCSLSNTLFRRDAGALAAYVVDLETGEWHPRLSAGQRRHDVEVTRVNVAGGLMDLHAELSLPADPDPVETGDDLVARYERLWRELTHEEVVGRDERYRIEARIRRLNELGFDVDEVELEATEDGDRLVVKTAVTERGYHRQRLLSLVGLHAQENQARSLLNDLASFRAHLERQSGRPVPESVAAYRWVNDIFEPTVAAIPESERGKREPAEVFHEVIGHKWFLSEKAGHDVGLSETLRSYFERVLPTAEEEKTVLVNRDGYMSYG
ncbi:MAG: DUF4032 domain-containing protein [Actinobacteria bacterium]|nr:DUF4032 domain-containing protein [Actinomycetota bacterium]